ncbi:MAG: hypothetical protein WB988_08040 [Candidatus Nitrosopolaris sp.]
MISLLGMHRRSRNATKFLEYDNSTYGIKMQYPSDWRVEVAAIHPSSPHFIHEEIMQATSRYK